MRSPSTFLVWGAGGHGRVVADLVRACGHHVAGFIDSDHAKLGQRVGAGEARVVFGEQAFLECIRTHGHPPEGVDAVALAIGHNTARDARLRHLNGCPVPWLCHPSAVVSCSAVMGRGSVIMPHAVINAEARIGNAVIVNTGAIVEHDCDLGDGVHVSPGAVLAGGARVGERSWIGAGATVIEGVVIGADVTVGAGAVVIRDVPDAVTVVGVPAKGLHTRAIPGT